ncbi:MAG: hypothetical protein K9K35_07680 [Rhodoferax sp.]|nr:hypothetical protein [Rhodoferax sp.]
MKNLTRPGLQLLILMALNGCTFTGTGEGQMSRQGASDQPVEFVWKSTDAGITGTMTASLPGDVFEGRFFQITSLTKGELLDPLWVHWRRGWHDWPYWGSSWSPPYPTTQFITHYSGKVVATLTSQTGQRMRCRFHLSSPAMGMRGGGEGQCQLSDDRLVRAVFSAK